ncbi:MAG: DMT family transporter [Neisseria sp.]|nr:DMT family transporter [Neisseria sp.]
MFSIKKLSAIAIFITPPLMWAGNVIVARAVREDVPANSLAFYRWLISLLILLPFVWKIVARDKSLYWQNRWLVLGTSLTGIAAFNTLIYNGLHHTSSTNTLLFNSCIPILIILIGAAFYQQKLSWRQALGSLLSLFGVLLIVLQGSWQNLLALNFNRGDIWVFIAVCAWAVYTLWMKRLPIEINRLGLMAVQVGIGLLLLLPLFWFDQTSGLHSNWQPSSLLSLLYIGIFPSVIAYLCYNAAIKHFGAVRAGMSIHLMPVFGTIMAITLLGEQLYAFHLAGIVAIVVGLVLSQR